MKEFGGKAINQIVVPFLSSNGYIRSKNLTQTRGNSLNPKVDLSSKQLSCLLLSLPSKTTLSHQSISNFSTPLNIQKIEEEVVILNDRTLFVGLMNCWSRSELIIIDVFGTFLRHKPCVFMRRWLLRGHEAKNNNNLVQIKTTQSS